MLAAGITILAQRGLFKLIEGYTGSYENLQADLDAFPEFLLKMEEEDGWL